MDRSLAVTHTGLGSALLAQGQIEAAEAEFRKAIEVFPNLSIAHSDLGQVLHVRRQPDEALAELRLAVELEPDNWVAQAARAAVLRQVGRRDDAVAQVRQALQLSSEPAAQALLHAQLGALLFDAGDSDGAKAALQRALELDPQVTKSLDQTVSFLLKRASQVGSPDLAQVHLVDACWLVLTAERLAPDAAARSSMMRRIDDELGGRQRCPP